MIKGKLIKFTLSDKLYRIDIKMNDSWSRIRDFDSHWAGNEDNEQSKLNTFITQVLLASDTYLKFLWTEISDLETNERRFCLLLGCEYDRGIVDSFDLFIQDAYNNTPESDFFGSTHVYRQLEKAKNTQDIKHLAKILQIIFLILEEKAKAIDSRNKLANNWIKDTNKIDKIINDFYKELKGLLNCTNYFALVKQGQSVTLYPAGSKLLDEQIIEKTLEKLEKYPEVSITFKKALRDRNNSNDSRQCLDNLRLSLEQLAKTILNNKKTLENQIDENKDDKSNTDALSIFGKFLKDKDMDKEFRKFLSAVLHGFCQYQNGKVKHSNKEKSFFKEEVEYNIYLTGSLIRIFIELNELPDVISEKDS